MTTFVTEGDDTHLPDSSIVASIIRITLPCPGPHPHLVATNPEGDQL